MRDLDIDILEAVGDLDRWPRVLERIAAHFGCHGAGLLPITDPGEFRVTPSILPAFADYVDQGIHLTDPRLKLAPLLKTNKVVDDRHAYSADEIARMEYYQDWLPSQDLGPFAGIRGGGAGDPFVVTLYRGMGDRAFGDADRAEMARLSDQLMRVVAIEKAIGAQAMSDRAGWHERTGSGVVGLSRTGRVTFVGGNVERHLGYHIAIRHDRVVFCDATHEASFLRALRQSDRISHAAALGQSHGRVLPVPVYLPATSHWSPSVEGNGAGVSASSATVLQIHPITEAYRGFVAAAHLMVLSDPFATRRAGDAAFVALWDLTAREAELVGHLVDGRVLAEAARAMNIREASARTYLKAIYRKTGTRAQSELVARAARLT